MHFSFIFAITILGLRPYQEPFALRMEYINEIVTIFVLYTLMCFSDYVKDEDVKYTLGYVPGILIAAHIVLNLFFILVDTMRKIMLKCKKLAKYIRRKKR